MAEEIIREETPRTVVVEREERDVPSRGSNTGIIIVAIILIVLVLLWLGGGRLFGGGGSGGGTNVNVSAPTPSVPSTKQ